MSQNAPLDCYCDCRSAHLRLFAPPLLRCICHCNLCRQFSGLPESDLLLFRARDAQLGETSRLKYCRMRRPPAVDRGVCADCERPLVEFLRLPLLPDVAFVPALRYPEPARLPAPAMRLFYDSRVADVDDALPRYEGYWPSQLAVVRRLLPALLRRD